MSNRKQTGFLLLILFITSILLSSCLGLAMDVAPPTQVQNQADRSPTSTPEISTLSPTETPIEQIPTQESDEKASQQGQVTVEIQDHSGGIGETLEVVLEGYDQGQQIFQTSETFQEAGSIRFGDVPLENGMFYFASVAYQGAVYRSDLIQVGPDMNSLSLTMDLYGTTADTSSLSVDRIHLFLDFPAPDQIQIGEIYIMSNFGDKTVVASEVGQPVVEFPLPKGAANLEFENGALGGRFIRTDQGFGDSVSIPPGSGVYQVMVFYTLPYQRNKLDFEQSMNYRVGAVVVMTPLNNLKLRSRFLEDMGVREIQNGAIQVYSGGELEEGSQLKFQISGQLAELQAGTSSAESDGNWIWILPGILGGALVGVGIFFFIQTRKKSVQEDQREILEREKTDLLDSIIALDELYQDGEVEQDAYQQKREDLKNQLQNVLSLLDDNKENHD